MGVAVQGEKEANATAEVFITALKAMPEEVKERIYEYLAKDPELMEDLLDTSLIENRREEESSSFDDFLKEIS